MEEHARLTDSDFEDVQISVEDLSSSFEKLADEFDSRYSGAAQCLDKLIYNLLRSPFGDSLTPQDRKVFLSYRICESFQTPTQ